MAEAGFEPTTMTFRSLAITTRPPPMPQIARLQILTFRFLGVLMGIAIRTGSPLSLNLAEPIWKLLAGSQLTPNDITEVIRLVTFFHH